jgi:hypothetical protein
LPTNCFIAHQLFPCPPTVSLPINCQKNVADKINAGLPHKLPNMWLVQNFRWKCLPALLLSRKKRILQKMYFPGLMGVAQLNFGSKQKWTELLIT